MIDLHTHSLRSDGTDTPGELINKALALNLDVLALTDHDTMEGWQEAKNYLRPGLDLVLGAEISCQTEDGISVHMLGLLFDGENQILHETLTQTRENRHGRMERIVTRLQGAGIDIELSEVLEQLSEGATLGRPHLADALVKKRIVKSREEAFATLLHNNSKYYVPHFSPTPEEIVKQVAEAGGVSIIAHPFASLRGRTINSETFTGLVAAGLNGIEVDHRDQTPDQRAQLRAIAREFGLVVTGSSDYHGIGKDNRLAECSTAPEEWERLESLANDRRVVRA